MHRLAWLLIAAGLVLPVRALGGVAFISDMQIQKFTPDSIVHDENYTERWGRRVAESIQSRYGWPIDRIHDGGDIVEGTGNVVWEYLTYLTIWDFTGSANPQRLRAVPGNHDRDGGLFQQYLGVDYSRRWWQDTAGGIHVLGLNRVLSSFSEAEVESIRAILHDDEQGFQPTIVYFHHSMYTGNCRVRGVCYDVPTRGICQLLRPIFESERVDLVISGHAHDYEHMEVNGVTYLVIGGAGAALDVSIVTPETVVPGLHDGVSFHHWVYVDPIPAGVEVQVFRVYADSAGATRDEVFEKFQTPTRLNPGVISDSVQFAATNNGNNATWTFTWETEYTSHQVLDQVDLVRLNGLPECVTPATLVDSLPGVSVDVVPVVASERYRHTLTWSEAPVCPDAPCGWRYQVSSAVRSQGLSGSPISLSWRDSCVLHALPPSPESRSRAEWRYTCPKPGPIVEDLRGEQLESSTPEAGLLSISQNPVREPATIRFAVDRSATVHLEVLNVSGRRVRSIVERDLSAGEHTAVWDAKDDRGRRVASGVYILRLHAGEAQFARRIVVVQ